MSNHIDFRRLSYLGDRLKAGLATKQEKDEYMQMLFRNGSITQQQYNEYLANGNKINTDEIVDAALAVGAVLLIGYLIKEMFKPK
jgi:preprotein translocase subunit Sec61beta